MSRFSRKRDRFVLSVGDDGAVLSYFRKNVLIKRLFANSAATEDTDAFKELLNRYKSGEILILVDVVDQSYVQQPLPGVGVLGIKKIVNNRLKRDYAPTDLKGAIMLGRATTGRKDWHYLFIAVPNEPPLSSWLAFIETVDNPLQGIHLLPVESAPLLNELMEIVPREAKGKPSIWKLMITHNKTGGFRLIVVKKDKLVFTRMLGDTQDNVPAIIAGNIEQEIANTIEYLRRLSLQADDTLDVIVTVSEDIKKRIDPAKIKATHISLFTPYELANILEIRNGADEGDRFSDTVFASFFVSRRPVLTLQTGSIKQYQLLHFAQRGAMATAGVLIPGLMIASLLNLFSAWRDATKAGEAENQKIALLTQYNAQAKEFMGERSLEDVTKINDVTALYKLLSGSAYSPLSTIEDFYRIQGKDIMVKTIVWNYTEQAQTPPTDGTAAPTPGTFPSGTIRVTFDILFQNSESSIDSLFENFEDFISRLEQQFSDYTLNYTRLPSKISFDERSKPIPIQINIEGPKKVTDPAQPSGGSS
ncbi:MAG: hypothetical protein K0R63_1311 [Rickettsiales bacterium]|nr:hypothetical protein [Rickettsiales bacterium]